MANAKRGAIIEHKLIADEQEQFSCATDKALLVQITAGAWKAVSKEQVSEEHVVPMIYVLGWKTDRSGAKEANARACLQAFKHVGAVTKVLDKESPTLSRVGRYVILLILCLNRWGEMFTADVQKAFLQGPDLKDLGIRIFAKPNKDMR